MPNDGSEEFLSAAEQDLSALEDLKYFGFRSANTACFLAQQYAEKMIKARLLQLGLKFERSHNLVFLMDDLGPGKNLDLPVTIVGF
jgi:HEPN domain-containing protein